MNTESSNTSLGRGSICILSESYLPQRGGTPTQIRAMVAGLRMRGFECMVVTRRVAPEDAEIELIDGVQVRRISPTGLGSSKKWRMLPAALKTLIVLRRKYEIIYVPGFRVIGISAVIAAGLLGKKTVFRAVSRGEMSGDFFKSGLARKSPAFKFMFSLFLRMRRAILKKADRYVAISSPMRRELLEAGIEPERIADIPNGVDAELFRPAEPDEKQFLRRKLCVPPDAFVIEYTGRLVRYKGLIALIDAFTAFSRNVSQAYLLLVGDGGNDIHNCEEELKKRVNQAGIADRVEFSGAVENVAEYLRLADCFLFPTEDEAFGISLIEAMSCGLPVVSTDTGGIADYLEDGVNGLVVPAGDPEEFSRRIQELYDDPALREFLGSRARTTVGGRFAQEFIDARYAELFDSLKKGAGLEIKRQ
ncbi:MAG: glycosyltransferase family 4 protein [Verrucomicrobiota bacterium]